MPVPHQKHGCHNALFPCCHHTSRPSSSVANPNQQVEGETSAKSEIAHVFFINPNIFKSVLELF